MRRNGGVPQDLRAVQGFNRNVYHNLTSAGDSQASESTSEVRVAWPGNNSLKRRYCIQGESAKAEGSGRSFSDSDRSSSEW